MGARLTVVEEAGDSAQRNIAISTQLNAAAAEQITPLTTWCDDALEAWDRSGQAQKPSRCVCGKIPFTWDQAEQQLLEFKILHDVRGNEARRERRIYACRTVPWTWHFTSSENWYAGETVT
ncbi:hypothetical protein FHX73_18122 [Kitasatospora viridis]|uniref:Uncharacterized protein n=2 Tax=Kitasatospora viridis TaxID=281105 RepID=A0A561SA49_9ACTN|nr:hypothetical protein FHX73_18122 [Kitasatospora viridis]